MTESPSRANDAADAPTPVGLLLSGDLIFTSRIAGTAAGRSVAVEAAPTVERLHALALARAPRGVIVDLAHPGLDVAGLLAWLKGHSTPPPRVVGYGPHVEAALLRAARAAGCHEVYPRSKFVEVLPDAIARWVRGEAGA